MQFLHEVTHSFVCVNLNFFHLGVIIINRLEKIDHLIICDDAAGTVGENMSHFIFMFFISSSTPNNFKPSAS